MGKFVLPEQPVKPPPDEPIPKHKGNVSELVFECDYCDKNIAGKERYRCARCKDFDLCGPCYKKKGHKHFLWYMGVVPVKKQGTIPKPESPKKAKQSRARSESKPELPPPTPGTPRAKSHPPRSNQTPSPPPRIPKPSSSRQTAKPSPEKPRPPRGKKKPEKRAASPTPSPASAKRARKSRVIDDEDDSSSAPSPDTAKKPRGSKARSEGSPVKPEGEAPSAKAKKRRPVDAANDSVPTTPAAKARPKKTPGSHRKVQCDEHDPFYDVQPGSDSPSPGDDVSGGLEWIMRQSPTTTAIEDLQVSWQETVEVHVAVPEATDKYRKHIIPPSKLLPVPSDSFLLNCSWFGDDDRPLRAIEWRCFDEGTGRGILAVLTTDRQYSEYVLLIEIEGAGKATCSVGDFYVLRTCRPRDDLEGTITSMQWLPSTDSPVRSCGVLALSTLCSDQEVTTTTLQVLCIPLSAEKPVQRGSKLRVPAVEASGPSRTLEGRYGDCQWLLRGGKTISLAVGGETNGIYRVVTHYLSDKGELLPLTSILADWCHSNMLYATRRVRFSNSSRLFTLVVGRLFEEANSAGAGQLWAMGGASTAPPSRALEFVTPPVTAMCWNQSTPAPVIGTSSGALCILSGFREAPIWLMHPMATLFQEHAVQGVSVGHKNDAKRLVYATSGGLLRTMGWSTSRNPSCTQCQGGSEWLEEVCSCNLPLKKKVSAPVAWLFRTGPRQLRLWNGSSVPKCLVNFSEASLCKDCYRPSCLPFCAVTQKPHTIRSIANQEELVKDELSRMMEEIEGEIKGAEKEGSEEVDEAAVGLAVKEYSCGVCPQDVSLAVDHTLGFFAMASLQGGCILLGNIASAQ